MEGFFRINTNLLKKGILRVLETGPKTSREIASLLNNSRHQNYIGWIPSELNWSLSALKQEGKVFVIKKKRGYYKYALARGNDAA